MAFLYAKRCGGSNPRLIYTFVKNGLMTSRLLLNCLLFCCMALVWIARDLMFLLPALHWFTRWRAMARERSPFIFLGTDVQALLPMASQLPGVQAWPIKWPASILSQKV